MIRLYEGWELLTDKFEYREFKKGILEIRKKGKRKPFLFITQHSALSEYMEVYDAFNGNLQALIENADEIKDEFEIK